MRNKCLAIGALVAATWAWLSAAARAEDRYYMIVYASQGQPKLPRFSHTFATFIKASDKLDKLQGPHIEAHTISWLPATLTVRPLRLQPQPGRNLNLKETMDWAAALNAQVTSWGPHPIKKELYDKGRAQIKRLESGTISFLALDGQFRGRGATNCIHAVADVLTDKALLETGTAHGEAASAQVVRHFQPWFEQASPQEVARLQERLKAPATSAASHSSMSVALPR